MQVNNNINSMVQIEKKLEQSASELSKLSLNTKQPEDKNENNLSKNTSKKEKELSSNSDVASEMVKQIEIPIAYTANAEVISTQSSISQTLIDIKA
jgi:flagellar hook protein FlgE